MSRADCLKGLPAAGGLSPRELRETELTFVYTLFVRFGEECSRIAYEVVPDIENVHSFRDFYNVLILKGLWNENFAELADNGPFGCSAVVGVNS